MGYEAQRVVQPRKPIPHAELDRALHLHELYRNARPGGQRALLAYRDLSGCDLAGRDLSHADLSAAFLVGTNLEGANLTGAVLFASNLSQADLRNAVLVRADLRGAVLRGADLTGADLTDADLRDGHIVVRQRSGELHDIEINVAAGPAPQGYGGAEWHQGVQQCAHTDFSDAVMRNTRLVKADLRQATLTGADLGGADLSGADLRGANLADAVLAGASLERAHTAGANLNNALRDQPAGLRIEDLEHPLATLIARHARWVETEAREGTQLDLTGFDLRTVSSLAGAELAALKACDAVFFGLDLRGIGLQAGQLDRADLRASNLRGADLRGISLKGARLVNADLRDCRLGPLVVRRDQIIVSRLDDAEFRHADLRGADLRRAVLRGADFTGADLTGAQLDADTIEATGPDRADEIV